jgi:retron-type reverse transcriptase
MLMAQRCVEIARKRGEAKKPLNRVYRMLSDQELYLEAYAKLYSNPGAMTSGVDSEDTVDGMSLTKIDRIIERLQQGTSTWKPVRRVYIQKANGKRRPLGIPGWSDKLLQEVIRMIVEAYYEPQFRESSHGFRPERGCQTILADIQRRWTGVKWFIE